MELRKSAVRQNPTRIAFDDVVSRLSQRGRVAIQLLYDTYEYAQQLGRSIWDFAEEVASLRQHGLTNGDLRWLVCNGLVEHGREITEDGERGRRFQHEVGLHFSEKTCFVLTEAGATSVRGCVIKPTGNGTTPHVHPESKALNQTNGSLTPTWDRDLQELRLGTTIVKQFKVPAPNQEIILAVFQEENWPVYIDDPLPPHAEIDSKRRLHDTINSLNRNQRNHLIHFRGNGSGKGVRWELVQYSESSER